MKSVNCPYCGAKCIRHGKNSSGTQRWFCPECKSSFTPKIDNSSKQLNMFLKWLFGRSAQGNMPGGGRIFRRNTAKFWYLCRYEHSGAWKALMSRIAEPVMVVSDGGSVINKALRKTWPRAKHQRCLFHVFSQIKRYTTTRPKTLAGIELYALAKDLLKLGTKEEAEKWTERFVEWMSKYNRFLSQMSRDENGSWRYTHERLLKAQRSIVRLIKENSMFTYLDKQLSQEIDELPSTNNRIEGGVNSRIRALLRDHRGLSVERRIKAVFWWCYMHSPEPLSASEILKVMPTDKSISDIYERITDSEKRTSTIPMWGDAIVWSEHRGVCKFFCK